MLKSVVYPQLFHWLQVMKMPKQISKQLEQLMRNFLWKGRTENSATIQVKWNLVCQKKENGGLGLLSLNSWNDAVLTKLLNDIGRASNTLWTDSKGNRYGKLKQKPQILPYGNTCYRCKERSSTTSFTKSKMEIR